MPRFTATWRIALSLALCAVLFEAGARPFDQTGPAPAALPALATYGVDVATKAALRTVVPAGWQLFVHRDVTLPASMSWRAGVTWPGALAEFVEGTGVSVLVDWERKALYFRPAVLAVEDAVLRTQIAQAATTPLPALRAGATGLVATVPDLARATAPPASTVSPDTVAALEVKLRALEARLSAAPPGPVADAQRLAARLSTPEAALHANAAVAPAAPAASAPATPAPPSTVTRLPARGLLGPVGSLAPVVVEPAPPAGGPLSGAHPSPPAPEVPQALVAASVSALASTATAVGATAHAFGAVGLVASAAAPAPTPKARAPEGVPSTAHAEPPYASLPEPSAAAGQYTVLSAARSFRGASVREVAQHVADTHDLALVMVGGEPVFSGPVTVLGGDAGEDMRLMHKALGDASGVSFELFRDERVLRVDVRSDGLKSYARVAELPYAGPLPARGTARPDARTLLVRAGSELAPGAVPALALPPSAPAAVAAATAPSVAAPQAVELVEPPLRLEIGVGEDLQTALTAFLRAQGYETRWQVDDLFEASSAFVGQGGTVSDVLSLLLPRLGLSADIQTDSKRVTVRPFDPLRDAK